MFIGLHRGGNTGRSYGALLIVVIVFLQTVCPDGALFFLYFAQIFSPVGAVGHAQILNYQLFIKIADLLL